MNETPPAPLTLPPGVIPLPQYEVKRYEGTTPLDLGTALIVLLIITLILPRKWGIWIPFLILLGYGSSAKGQKTLGKLLGFQPDPAVMKRGGN